MSAATIDNGAEDMRVIAGGLAEEIGGILEVLLHHGLIDGRELVGLEFALIRAEALELIE